MSRFNGMSLVGGLLLIALFWVALPKTDAFPKENSAQDITLEDVVAGRAEMIDLTYPLNSKNAFWPGENYKPFELKTIATIEKDGVLSKSIRLPEHLGTHLDAPNHFEKNQPSVEKLTARQLFGPGIVIDIAPQAEQNADYTLTEKDVKSWENSTGRFPRRRLCCSIRVGDGFGETWPAFKIGMPAGNCISRHTRRGRLGT